MDKTPILFNIGLKIELRFGVFIIFMAYMHITSLLSGYDEKTLCKSRGSV